MKDYIAEFEATLRRDHPEATDVQISGVMADLSQILADFVRKVEERKAGYCRDCSHSWLYHDQLIEGAGSNVLPGYNLDNLVDLYECTAYAGMGDWCGCENRSRQPRRRKPEQDLSSP